jgi:tetratricopeptide (TPR) repeat protein
MRHLLIIFLIGISISSFAQETTESLFKKGEQAFKEGNYELTVDYFTKCISKNRNLMEAYWYRGLAYLNQNSTQEALKDINKALELSKSSDKDSQQSLYSIRAQIFYNTSNYKDAINDYSKALSLNAKNLGNYWSRALCYYYTEEYNKALKDFEQCEKLIDVNDKDNLTELYSLIAGIYQKLENKEKAINYYTKSISIKEENNKSFLYRANLYYELEEFSKAINDFTKALNIFRTDNKTKDYLYTQRAQSYTRIGEYEKAINDIDQAISISPNYYQFLVRGEANRLAGRYKFAIVDFSKSIELEPNNSFAYYRRGWSKEFDRNFDEAFVDYNTSIELSPDYSHTYLNRGRLTEKIYGFEKAKSDYEKIIALESKSEDPDNSYHYALFHLGKPEEALNVALNKIKRQPTGGNYYDLACLYSLMNKKNEAIQSLEKAIINGYSNFIHMANDDDLDNIKYSKDFESFIAKYNIKITLPNPTSDINIQIPETNLNFNHRFALIIGNEDYSSYQVGLSKEINVDFARNDAIAIREYFIKVFGIPERNITFLTNATAAQTMQGLERLSKLASVTGGKAEIFFYYAGHGIADQETKESYIIPVDVNATNLNFAIKLQDVYNKLTEHPSQRITVFLDACFSGGARNKELLGMRAVRVRPKANAIKGNLVIFASSSDTENSQPLNSQNHGLFTYFLLKKIKETKGNVSYEELYKYVKENVSLESILNKNLTQTPSIIASPEIENVWSNWKINK